MASSIRNLAISFATTALGPLCAQGHGLRFDGIDDIAFSNTVPAQTTHTIELIVRASAAGSNGTIASQHGVDGSCSHGCCELLIFRPSNTLYYNVDVPACGGGGLLTAPPPLGGSWHHVAGIYSGTTQSIYVDGILVASRPWSGATQRSGFSLGDAMTRVRPCAVDILEARFWSQARTEPELRDSMYAGAQSIVGQPGLVALYRLDEGTGQLAQDSSGNGHHLQLGDGAGADSADPAWLTPRGSYPFGVGCPGSGACLPELGTTGLTSGSAALTIDLSSALGGTPAILVLDLSGQPGSGQPIPLDPPGATCVIRAQPDLLLAFVTTGGGPCNGTASLGIPIPTSLPPGFWFAAQWAVIDSAAPGIGAAVSAPAACML